MEKKKLTLAEIIAKKAEKKNKEHTTEDVFVESLGGDITIRRVSKEIVYRALDMMGETASNNVYANAYIVYHGVAEFQSQELTNDEKEPVNVVYNLLELYEISDLASKIMKLSGVIKPEDTANEVKN